MSKKMMKRSLALGALMAFVITGSAMAAEQHGSVVTGKITLDGINISCDTSCNHYGMSVKNGADLTINGDTSIVVDGAKNGNLSIGYYQEDSASNFAEFSGNTTIKVTSADLVRAVNVQSNDGATNTVTFANGKTLIQATGTGVQKCVMGLYVSGSNSTKVEFKGANDVTIDAKSAYEAIGVRVQAEGSVVSSLDSNVKITATGAGLQAVALFNDNKKAPGDRGDGTINLQGDVELNATCENSKEAYAILNWGGAGNTTVGTKDVSKVVINGDVYAKSGTVNINLGTADSKFTGYAYQTNTGKINISMNSSTWDVTDSVNNMWDTQENVVEKIEGTGTIIVGANDKVKVLNDEANLTVRQADVNADTVVDQQAHLDALASAVVDSEGNSVADTVAIAEGDIVGAVTASVEDGKVGKAVEAVNTTNQAIGEAAVAVKAHYRAHMNDMNKRMGELRNANGEHGVWTRMVRGESEYEGMKAQYNQYQLGYDEKLSVDKRWTVGAAVTFAEGEGSFGIGSTEDDSTAFAIYGSKLNNDGTFVDLIARYAHMESDVTVGADKGDYDVNGYSVSAEFGKRIQQGKGFWIEPQVELTYGTVDSAEYVIGGKTVQVGDMDSLIGRVGFSLGKDIKQGNVYARASYLYDFDGETESAFSNAAGVNRTIEEDLGGGWWEVGVGANINLSKATYVYADIEKTFGGEVDTNWQWNLGVRYSF